MQKRLPPAIIRHMKAIQMQKGGGPEVLELVEKSLPQQGRVYSIHTLDHERDLRRARMR